MLRRAENMGHHIQQKKRKELEMIESLTPFLLVCEFLNGSVLFIKETAKILYHCVNKTAHGYCERTSCIKDHRGNKIVALMPT
jgi:hypothetical protein